MSLRELLTRPIRFGSWEFNWSEPWLCRIRLRGDLWYRVGLLAAGWLFATGLMLLLFAFNVNPPDAGLAAGLGVIFGLCPASMILFFRRNNVSGNVRIYDDRILHYKTSVGIPLIEHSETIWPFAGLDRCVLISGKKIGQKFHVMVLESDGERRLLAVPSNTDMQHLARYVAARNVDVVSASTIPPEYRAGIKTAVAGTLSLIAIVSLAAGVFVYRQRVGFSDPGPQQFARPELPGGLPGRMLIPPAGPADSDPAQTNFGVVSVPDVTTPATQEVQTPGPIPPGSGPAAAGPAGSGRIGQLSGLIGGSGGFPFRLQSDNGTPVLTIRCRMGNWGGRQRIAKLEPLFATPSGDGIPNPGQDPNWEYRTARQGYALGALQVDASDFVDAVAPVFMKITGDGKLDPEDAYTDEWLGSPAGRSSGESTSSGSATISGNGAPVIGLHGRGGAVMDAIGLVLLSADHEPTGR